MENKENTNSFDLVGRLASADVRTGTAKNGHAYVSVNATIRGTEDHEYAVSFYASDTNSKGEPSKLYAKYMNIKEMEGKKVHVVGSLRESRFFSTKQNQMVGAQVLSGRFIDAVSDSESDKAEWELGGFVVSPLAEKANKGGEVYRYDLKIGQMGSNGKLSVFTLHASPDNREIISGVRAYNVGNTVKINGILDFTAKEITVESANEGGFGKPRSKTFINHTRNYFITGGTAPIKDDTAYDAELIHSLVDEWKARDVEKVESAKDETPAVSQEPTISARQTSLI